MCIRDSPRAEAPKSDGNAEDPRELLRHLNKADIVEVKSMRNPPEKTSQTLQLVYGLLHEKKVGTWNDVVTMLNDTAFLSKLTAYDPIAAPHDVIKWAEEYIQTHGLELDSIKKTSRCASSLFAWVKGIIALRNSQSDGNAGATSQAN
eukprot:TRINITY_DN10301_c0_g1_i2.p1 TRINITY_DN10301_c0_g1~~TRINITY_DN10301_c0_g1_i2.p1  ORF type:complete len:148 (-),score=19.03 TRINITY_DN10301_c0_g1_i2:178-621(-)